MIIFGWGRVTNKEFGPTMAVNCPNCNNDSWWNLFRQRTWFTLFFIPVIPYGSQHLLLCDVCSQGIQLKGEQVERAKEMNALTQEFLNKTISESDYQNRSAQIEVLA